MKRYHTAFLEHCQEGQKHELCPHTSSIQRKLDITSGDAPHDSTHRSYVRRVRVPQQLLDLPHRDLQREQPVQQTERSGRAPCVAAHPWLDVVDVVVDLVHHLLPGAQLEARIPEIVRVYDVLPEHILKVVRRWVAMDFHICFPFVAKLAPLAGGLAAPTL